MDVMQDVSEARFNALAGYSRNFRTIRVGREIRWFQSYEEKILATLVQDKEDKDFVVIFFARDLRERYRFVRMTEFNTSSKAAIQEAKNLATDLNQKYEKSRIQGDELGVPVDFFTPVAQSHRLNNSFKTIVELGEESAAGELIKPMMRWHEDIDGNFVEQFQTAAFEARLWELYIFATLIECNFALDKSHAAPDFVAQSIFGDVCIEATTVNHSMDEAKKSPLPVPPTNTIEQKREFEKNYMPMKFSRSLKSKLSMRYWEEEPIHRT